MCLGEHTFQPSCQDGLANLSGQGPLGPQPGFGDLLGDRAASLADAACFQVRPGGADDSAPVDAVVFVEAPVLDGLERLLESFRYSIDAHPLAVLGREFGQGSAVVGEDAGDGRGLLSVLFGRLGQGDASGEVSIYPGTEGKRMQDQGEDPEQVIFAQPEPKATVAFAFHLESAAVDPIPGRGPPSGGSRLVQPGAAGRGTLDFPCRSGLLRAAVCTRLLHWFSIRSCLVMLQTVSSDRACEYRSRAEAAPASIGHEQRPRPRVSVTSNCCEPRSRVAAAHHDVHH